MEFLLENDNEFFYYDTNDVNDDDSTTCDDDDNNNNEWFTAIINNDFIKIKEFLKDKDSTFINERYYGNTYYKMTGLMILLQNFKACINSIDVIYTYFNHKNLDINIQDISGNNYLFYIYKPFESISRHIHLKLFKLCLSKANIHHHINKQGLNILQHICMYGGINYIDLLLHKIKTSNAFNINHTDFLHRTALLIACRYNRYEIIKKLLTIHDLDVNIADNDGFTPLLKAIRFHYYDVVKLLLEKKI